MSPNKLKGFSDRIWDIQNCNRYAVFHHHIIDLSLSAEELFGLRSSTDKSINKFAYWRVDWSGEIHVTGADYEFVLYVQYFLDDMPKVIGLPRFSKDNLLQWGVRFYK